MTKKQITSLLLLGASILYDVIPTDLIPDIPLIGWLDDILVTSSAAMNCIQQFMPEGAANKIMQWLKWVCIVIVILIVIVLLLLTGTILSISK